MNRSSVCIALAIMSLAPATPASAAPQPASSSAVRQVTTGPATAGGPALPTSAKVTDHRGDSQSKTFDVLWVKGAKVDQEVVLRMKVKNLTKANTKKVPDGDGNSYHRTTANVIIAIDGYKGDYVNVSRLPTSPKGQGYISSRYGDSWADCNGEGENYGIGYVTNYAKDVVTLRFPVDCIAMETLHVSGRFYDDRNLSKPKEDVVAKRSGGTQNLRWSAPFAVQ